MSEATQTGGMNKETQLHEQILVLKDLLLKQHPQMPTLLQQLHHNIKKDEDLAMILSEEELGVIVEGLKAHANIQIATNVMKKTGSRSMKDISLDDL